MPNVRKLVACFALLALSVTTALAVEGGNPKKGKFLYKKNCKSCHVEGGEGKNLSPLNKTQSQWNRLFDKGTHPKKGEVWKGLSEQDLKDINQYLYNHAADSDQPETCG
ncbi:MAG: cytochrome c [Desulfuromonadales bacterium]|nr:cytochrome c [Desulfuromonadales bacterium]